MKTVLAIDTPAFVWIGRGTEIWVGHEWPRTRDMWRCFVPEPYQAPDDQAEWIYRDPDNWPWRGALQHPTGAFEGAGL